MEVQLLLNFGNLIRGGNKILIYNELLENLLLINSDLYNEEPIEMKTMTSFFTPPAEALMNALRTPQLEFSEIISSDDYIKNNNNFED